MKKSMLILLVMFLTSACEDTENPHKIRENSPVQTTAATTEISDITTAETAVIREKITTQTTAATDFENATEFRIKTGTFEETTAGFPEIQPETESQTTVTVSEIAEENDPVDSVTTAVQTEISITEIPDISQKSDCEKAWEIYSYMRENGSGTCVNYACQTYEMCREVGLPCYIVWTNAGMYGHVANTVCVNGTWFILDMQSGYFLECNYGFTEVVDIDGNHIADGDMLSNYSYDELN